jgi:ankyrin repeat protein
MREPTITETQNFRRIVASMAEEELEAHMKSIRYPKETICLIITDLIKEKTEKSKNTSEQMASKIKKLISIAAIDPDSVADKKSNATLLMLASQKGKHHIVNALLQSNADANKIDIKGQTALFYAFEVKSASYKILELLLQYSMLTQQNATLT